MSRSLSLPHINILHKNHMQRPNNLPNICKYLPPLVCPGNSRSYTGSRIIEKSSFLRAFFVCGRVLLAKILFFKIGLQQKSYKNQKKVARHSDFSNFFFTEFCRQNCGKFFMEIKCCGTLSQGNKLGRERLIQEDINANVCVQFLSKSPMCQGRQKKVFETKQKKNGRLKN